MAYKFASAAGPPPLALSFSTPQHLNAKPKHASQPSVSGPAPHEKAAAVYGMPLALLSWFSVSVLIVVALC